MAEALYRSAARAFQELAFAFTEPAEGGEAEGEAMPGASVAFEGAIAGRLAVRVAGDLLPELAASMLGEGEAPSAALQADALGELANVITGGMLPMLAGGSLLRLRPPEPLAAGVEIDCGPGERRAGTVSLLLDGRPGRVALFVRPIR